MDKWKEIELNKMKMGGNSKAKEWLSEQSDWKEGANLAEKYNSRAAALYKDKISAEAQGQNWSEETSSARNHKSSFLSSSGSSSSSKVQSSSRSSSSSGGGMKHSQSYHGTGSDSGAGGGGGYQGGGGGELTGAFHQTKEFKDKKEEFFERKQAENAMKRDDLPPSQGGKYAGFGSNCSSGPPARSYSTQDFASNTMGGLTSSLSSLGFNASNLGGKVAEVGWKFTSLAGQKAAELSENVTEKVKEGNLLTDLTTGVAGYAGKVSDVVVKRSFDLSSLWGSTRSEYQPCEDSGLLNTMGGSSGYQDLSDRSPGQDYSGGRNQDFGGFHDFENDRVEKKGGRKDSQDWGDGWDEGGWSEEPSPKKETEKKPKKASTRASASDKKSTTTKQKMEGELLIDFGGNQSSAVKDGWGNDWENDAWESLNKDD